MATRTTSSVTRGEAVAGERDDALAALEVADGERRGEARGRRRSAGRGSGRRRSRPPPPASTGRRRRRRPRCAAPAASAPRGDHLDVLGRERRSPRRRPRRGRAPARRRRCARRRDGPAPCSPRSAGRRPRARIVSAASSGEGVTSTTASSPLPCSACARRSAATTARVGRVVGEDRDLARTGLGVDLDPAAHEALGRGDVRVAGARRSCRRPGSSSSRTRARRWPGPRRRGRRAPRRRPRRSPPPRRGSPRAHAEA